jgi:hypothetical protein
VEGWGANAPRRMYHVPIVPERGDGTEGDWKVVPHPRARQCAQECLEIAEATADPVVRRARMLAARLRYVADALEGGEASAQRLGGRFAEQVEDSWAAFHSTPRDKPLPRPREEFLNLVRIGVASAVEEGALWLAARRRVDGITYQRAMEEAVLRAIDLFERGEYPEWAPKLIAERELLAVAIHAAARGGGRPAAGEPPGSKWDHIGDLCRRLRLGDRDIDADRVRRAWQERNPERLRDR